MPAKCEESGFLEEGRIEKEESVAEQEEEEGKGSTLKLYTCFMTIKRCKLMVCFAPDHHPILNYNLILVLD